MEETHQVFKVSKSTIEKWEKQLKETGDLAKKELYRSFRKIAPEKLKAYVEEHPDAYQRKMAEAGTDSDSKLACEIDPESGTIYVVEADYRYDLTDVSPTLLDTFRKCGICLDDLEIKLKEEAVVYGDEANESFSD